MYFLHQMELNEEATTLNLTSGKPDGFQAVMEQFKMAILYGFWRHGC